MHCVSSVIHVPGKHVKQPVFKRPVMQESQESTIPNERYIIKHFRLKVGSLNWPQHILIMLIII